MHFAKKFTKLLASIGTQIGRRDRMSRYACKTVDNLSFTDKQFRKYVEDLNQRLTVYKFLPVYIFTVYPAV